MKKPVKKARKPFYNYNKCRNFLQNKYDYEERDYAGKFKKGNANKDAPYLDFWHWVIENYDINNGCYITFHKDTLEEIEPAWIKEIYSHYIEEFADESGELVMWVEW